MRAHRVVVPLASNDRRRPLALELRARAGERPDLVGDLLRTLEDALESAVHGVPRLIDLPPLSRSERSRIWRDVSQLAMQIGWLPMAVAALPGLVARSPAIAAGRSLLVLLESDGLSATTREALQWLATRSLRPHILVRPYGFLVSRPRAGRRLPAAAVPLSLEDEARVRWRLILAQLDGARREAFEARLELARVLAARGKAFEARACVATERGGRSGARVRGIGARLDALARRQATERLARIAGGVKGRATMVEDFVGVLQLCQEIEDERAALARVAAFLRERLQASAVAFVALEHGTLRVLVRAGSDTPGMAAAARAIESGCAAPPGADRGPAEAAHPVHHAASIVGAVWCRWSAGMPIAVREAATLLGVAAAATAASVQATLDRHRVPAEGTSEVPELVGESAAIRAVRAAIVRAATSPFPVLIEGESGSGKELAARAIHTRGSRRDRRLCAVNCAALVEDLVEAELFGHARGAFTGAALDRAGLFEEANGGTLFLDEVAELGTRVQAKLLRTLQEGEVRRLGESIVRKVDVRIVAATNRPLAGEVNAGHFRRDLWYRLDVIRMTMPPLRERLEDLPLLVSHLWSALAQRTGSRATLSPGAVAALAAYDWPGNVRELQNVLASVLVASPNRGMLGPSALPAHIARVAALGPRTTLSAARQQFEERFVRAALARAGGRTSVAARELGISRQGLAKMLHRLGIARAADPRRRVSLPQS